MRIERWLYTIPLRVRSLFNRRHVEEDLAEEMQFHLEQRMAAGETRYEALRAMHGLEQSKENCRDARRVNMIENLGRDLRYAFRMLRKSPTFAAVAILSLALGIGANTAIFSLIDALLIRPLPVQAPNQLRLISLRTGRPHPQWALTYSMFQALQRGGDQVFSNLFTWSDHQFQMRSGSEMEHVDGAMASGDYFASLGVGAELGRTFTSDDDHPSGGKDGPVAVISDRFWSRHFQRNPSAIGSALTLDGVQFTVIGVMPPRFFGGDVTVRPNIWVPLSWASKIDDPVCIGSRSCWWLVVMGRVKPGLSPSQVDAGLQAISPQLLRETVPPNYDPAMQKKFVSWRFLSSPGAQGWSFLRLQFSDPIEILMILVGLVLLVTCANMANLLLARTSARHREIAVRLSVGAGRGRVIRQLLTESTLLSLVGGVVGIVFAFWLTRLLLAFLETRQQFGPVTGPIEIDLNPDWRVLLFTFLAAVGSGLLFGIAPALRATRVGIAASLKESANNFRSGSSRIGIGRLILTVQAGLAVLLVAAAGLFAGSLFRLLTVNIGFNPDNVFVITIDSDKRPEKNAALANLYTRLLERVNSLPGVQAASVLWFTPPSGGSGWDQSPVIPGRTDLSEEQRDTDINLIGPRFFEALQIRLLAGRPFNASDTASSQKVGIINDLAAHRFFPHTDPVGAEIFLDGKPVRIVGIAGDIAYMSPRDPEPPELYLPYTQKADGFPSLTFAIKTTPGFRGILPEFHQALHEIAPDIPIGIVKTMQEQVDDSVGTERLMASLSVFFGVLALLITSIGLHGVLAYTVTRRSGEIGIRMALGAARHNVIWLVLRETVGYVAAGIAMGVIGALATSKLIASFLYGVKPNDPGTLTLAIFALLLVAAAAAYIPAQRASRLDPTIALRQE